jgi:glycosyltransferase involved in cell wall biosynthesis
MTDSTPLRILHVMRAPVGGLFRHVIDLAREQTRRGHSVGIVADQNTGSDRAAQTLQELGRELALGVTRVPMSRQIGPLDRSALAHVAKRTQQQSVDVLHGHGAKGGAYARLAAGPALRAYTPHGGSLFYSPYSPAGIVYSRIERWLRKRTDLILFESEYALRTFERQVGAVPFCRVVHNGIGQADLEPIGGERGPADFVFIGELRWRKGIDVLLHALAALDADGWTGSAILYGDGPDRGACIELAGELGLTEQVTFPGESRPRPAFQSGQLLVIPSRQESLPYVVLEAAAARMPMVTTSVGGIPEIFGPDATALVPAGNRDALLKAMREMWQPSKRRTALIERLHRRVVSSFTVDAMTDAVLAGYATARSSRAS